MNETYLNRSKWVLQQLDRVEEHRQLNSDEFGLRIALREHIFALATDKDARWKQRSSCTWLKLGDNNTKYFHAVANGRNNSNSLMDIKDSDDSPISQQQLPEYLLQHFKGSIGQRTYHTRPFDLTHRVGQSFQEELAILDNEITEEEM